jgi:hypothetical protein
MPSSEVAVGQADWEVQVAAQVLPALPDGEADEADLLRVGPAGPPG